jgi:hypothetical protein
MNSPDLRESASGLSREEVAARLAKLEAAVADLQKTRSK